MMNRFNLLWKLSRVLIITFLACASLLVSMQIVGEGLRQLNGGLERAYMPLQSMEEQQDKLSKSFKGRRGIYLTSLAAANQKFLEATMAKILEAGLNTVVIDVKNNHGEVTYDTKVALAKTIGAKVPRLSLKKLLAKLKSKGIYVIARQVVFYDPKLASALKSRAAPWVLPTDAKAVQYNLEIAEEVAKGFDEIQFDYLRFPDGEELGNWKARYEAINEFLRQVHERLGNKINISIDVFGRTLWDWNRKKIDPIGQSLEDISLYVDLISPMVYPSHYENDRFRNHPYETVKLGLENGLRRNLEMRPFLQAFALRIPKGMNLPQYIREQIRAVKELGIDGYLFWNPGSDYTALWEALAADKDQ